MKMVVHWIDSADDSIFEGVAKASKSGSVLFIESLDETTTRFLNLRATRFVTLTSEEAPRE